MISYAQTLILVNLLLVKLFSFLSYLFRVAELRPANLIEWFLYFSSTFLYPPGPVMKPLDPRCLVPMISSSKGGSQTIFFSPPSLLFANDAAALPPCLFRRCTCHIHMYPCKKLTTFLSPLFSFRNDAAALPPRHFWRCTCYSYNTLIPL